MCAKIQVVIDAADPAKLADFWAFAALYPADTSRPLPGAERGGP
jgi:hypothetical protein